ncbi:unnamed protein product [Dibothriocephalus latus]|uniref:ELP1 alpha-solenoid domain-containing protein n=1 Tax=Dibothriocephalus latus TaxID=60516 RepID=A0A3P7NJ90_DIBLA|nr:unnamed protein product [Dibothriocephalus latus]
MLSVHSVISSIENRLKGTEVDPGHTQVSTPSISNAPRQLESGARLITAETCGTKVVLQMPRGNIEVIHPPALVFEYLRPLFDREEDTAQNVLSTSASTLSPDALLASNVAKLRDSLPKRSLVEPKFATKVNLVCDALLAAMRTADSKRYLLPILTCYVKKQPSEVEKGLLLLKGLRGNGDIQAWDKGLRHLQYYLTPINLFHIALGTYDLDLAEAMAARTQLDPKEYKPCLQELRGLMQDGEDPTLAEAYQHARIDLLLEPFLSANACRLWMLTVDRARFAASQSSSKPSNASDNEEDLADDEIRRQAAKLACRFRPRLPANWLFMHRA